MILDSILHPYSLIFLTAFVAGIISPQFHNRRKMMAAKTVGDGLTGLYLYLMGGLSGAAGAGIAAIGALIQALTPHHYLRQSAIPRVIFASILSAACIYFSYRTPLDILPILMTIICRFGELQSRAQRIRLVYWVTSFPWMAYHLMNGFYLPLAACIALNISLIHSMYRHRHAPILNHDDDDSKTG